MKRRVLFAGLALFPVLAFAQPGMETLTGSWLYERYLGFKQQAAVDASMFALYVSGVVDTQLISQKLEGTRPKWCQPEGMILLQYFHVVGQYLERHPERLHYHRAQLVIESLQEAWPCRTEQLWGSAP
jgi:Ssp1 endopeptidase immunity protein Rap1a